MISAKLSGSVWYAASKVEICVFENAAIPSKLINNFMAEKFKADQNIINANIVLINSISGHHNTSYTI